MTSGLDAAYVAQIRAAGVLIDLLANAAEQGLPPVAWMVTGGGSLVGHCLGASDVQRRASFEAWADLVGAHRLPDDVAPLWTVELRARAEDVRACRVDVVAWLDEPFGGEYR